MTPIRNRLNVLCISLTSKVQKFHVGNSAINFVSKRGREISEGGNQWISPVLPE